jgi:hypothetical protein
VRLKSKRRYWDLLGYHQFSISDSKRPYDPGWIPLTRHDVSGIVACWRLETIGPFQSGHFGTLYLHGRLYPLPLLLVCFRAYASSELLPACLQGSIPGLWLAVTGAGFPPARICDIAQPQPRPDPGFPKRLILRNAYRLPPYAGYNNSPYRLEGSVTPLVQSFGRKP